MQCGVWAGAVGGEAGVVAWDGCDMTVWIESQWVLETWSCLFLHTRYLLMQLICRNEAKAMKLGNGRAA